MGKRKVEEVVTAEFRVSWPNVLKPRPDQNGKLKYSLVALFSPGANLSVLQRLELEAGSALWGRDRKAWPPKYKNPFKDQKDLGKTIEGKWVLYPGSVAGAIYMNFSANSEYPPTLLGPDAQPIIEPSKFYAGCYARAVVSAFAYDNVGQGVSFNLAHVQKTKDGEPLTSRSKPENFFSPLEGVAGKDDASSVFG